jgi:hypothetical protein
LLLPTTLDTQAIINLDETFTFFYWDNSYAGHFGMYGK